MLIQYAYIKGNYDLASISVFYHPFPSSAIVTLPKKYTCRLDCEAQVSGPCRLRCNLVRERPWFAARRSLGRHRALSQHDFEGRSEPAGWPPRRESAMFFTFSTYVFRRLIHQISVALPLWCTFSNLDFLVRKVLIYLVILNYVSARVQSRSWGRKWMIKHRNTR